MHSVYVSKCSWNIQTLSFSTLPLLATHMRNRKSVKTVGIDGSFSNSVKLITNYVMPELNVLFSCQEPICQIQHSSDGGKTVEHSHWTKTSPPTTQVWRWSKHADKSAYLAAVSPVSGNHRAEAAITRSLPWRFLLWVHLELSVSNLKQHARVKGAWMDGYECYEKIWCCPKTHRLAIWPPMQSSLHLHLIG